MRGGSGARIDFCDATCTVRKRASNWQEQLSKIAMLKSLSSSKINFPTVKEWNPERSTYTMDWIAGRKADFTEDRTMAYLCDFVAQNFRKSTEVTLTCDVFFEKVDSIVTNCGGADHDLLVVINRFLSNLPERIAIPFGPCHGDLTEDNVLVDSQNGLHLIDPIPCFIESPVMDVCKMRQSLIYERGLMSGGYLQSLERAFVKSDELLYICDFMTIARILPYVNKGKYTETWVKDNLCKITSRWF